MDIDAQAVQRRWPVVAAALVKEPEARPTALVLAALGLAGVGFVTSSPAAGTIQAGLGGAGSFQPAPAGRAAAPRRPAHGAAAAKAPTGTTNTTTTADADGGALRTSCRAVVHFGDSTSSGLISTDYLPDPGQRMAAQYARVGVRRSQFDITPATSIVETPKGTTDAFTLAQDLRHSGYRGCWVLALGTNDAADVYVGSNVGLSARIDRMMSTIGDQPVMWVNAKSLVAMDQALGTTLERNGIHLEDAFNGTVVAAPRNRFSDTRAGAGK